MILIFITIHLFVHKNAKHKGTLGNLTVPKIIETVISFKHECTTHIMKQTVFRSNFMVQIFPTIITHTFNIHNYKTTSTNNNCTTKI